MLRSMEALNDILGSKYQIVSSDNADPVVLTKLPGEYLAINAEKEQEQEQNNTNVPNNQSIEMDSSANRQKIKTTDDHLFHFYIGSLTVVGLFILFRMIQKSR